ncbi:MAG: tRNA (adenosine(37)-N6)-threonylcarbamoyltransferase complex dimerization subunit type 1 TsaB [Moraxella sp.]|nr:tRNA (adenosine(37)-N6)-threonylcarbamoyltransferase complex dimerization subunit type 1 TsaB [Moraxella sp.]
MIVAFDTVFEQCSLAVLVDDELVYSDTIMGGRGQTEIILPMLDRAFTTLGIGVADVQAWAFNRGPGAFSGIRINTAVVQALSVANDAPCVGVSALQALAFAAAGADVPHGRRIAAVMDARQNQVYAGIFVVSEAGIVPAVDDGNHEYLLDYDGAVNADYVVGDGTKLVQHTATMIDIKPTAEHIARLAGLIQAAGGAVSAENALPVYLRNNAWKTLAEQVAEKQSIKK